MITLIATGFEGKSQAQEEKVIVSLTETPERKTEIELIVNHPAPSVIEIEEEWEPTIKAEKVEKPVLQPQDVAALRPEPRRETMKQETLPLFEEEHYMEPVLKTAPRNDYNNPVPARSEDVKNSQNLDSIERVPAYVRKKIKLQNVPHSSESNISRYNLLDDPQEDSPSLHPRNSFLHDNVD